MSRRRRYLISAGSERLLHPAAVSATTLQVAVKAGLAAALSVWIADLIGLTDPYWAGISAVIVMSATLGASFGAAVSRTLATIIGLLVAIAAVELFGQSYVLGGAVVGLLLVLLPFLGLSLGARLGAATSLLVTIVPGSDVLETAFARGANVPLGCVIAIAIGALLWPARAEQQLEERLRVDVVRSGETLSSSMRALAGRQAPEESPLEPAGEAERAALLRDALRERLLVHRRPTSPLVQQVAAVDELVSTAIELRAIAVEAAGDRAPELVAPELRALADRVLTLAHAYAAGDAGAYTAAVAATDESSQQLRTSFDEHRAARQTTGYDTDELARLFSVTRQAAAAVRLLGELGPSSADRRSCAGPNA